MTEQQPVKRYAAGRILAAVLLACLTSAAVAAPVDPESLAFEAQDRETDDTIFAVTVPYDFRDLHEDVGYISVVCMLERGRPHEWPRDSAIVRVTNGRAVGSLDFFWKATGYRSEEVTQADYREVSVNCKSYPTQRRSQLQDFSECLAPVCGWYPRRSLRNVLDEEQWRVIMENSSPPPVTEVSGTLR